MCHWWAWTHCLETPLMHWDPNRVMTVPTLQKVSYLKGFSWAQFLSTLHCQTYRNKVQEVWGLGFFGFLWGVGLWSFLVGFLFVLFCFVRIFLVLWDFFMLVVLGGLVGFGLFGFVVFLFSGGVCVLFLLLLVVLGFFSQLVVLWN